MSYDVIKLLTTIDVDSACYESSLSKDLGRVIVRKGEKRLYEECPTCRNKSLTSEKFFLMVPGQEPTEVLRRRCYRLKCNYWDDNGVVGVPRELPVIVCSGCGKGEAVDRTGRMGKWCRDCINEHREKKGRKKIETWEAVCPCGAKASVPFAPVDGGRPILCPGCFSKSRLEVSAVKIPCALDSCPNTFPEKAGQRFCSRACKTAFNNVVYREKTKAALAGTAPVNAIDGTMAFLQETVDRLDVVERELELELERIGVELEAVRADRSVLQRTIELISKLPSAGNSVPA